MVSADSRRELGWAVVELARRAGDAILEVYARDFDVVAKEDDSPLTQADLASHRVIRDGLKALTPDWPVLSEESAAIPWATRREWARYWLVDPLDGTKEFVNRNGEFTVNIALIEDHHPTLGAVHVPVSGRSFLGIPGDGAWVREDDGEPAAIGARQPHAHPPVVVASRSHGSEAVEALLERLGEHERVSMGSSLKFCRVAEGRADFYPRLGPTSEWDTAAAQAVVEGAGGRVVTLDGKALAYNTKQDILNPHFLVFGDPGRDWAALAG
ncbi:MAG: 3'(2'),5'-bisphosphate nucleotidase CysQ [Xanthomonadales bacterium]|nr:3'(2'),5'-bisphosphate nucleotidase CysQ [Xanthomonadales bacterium]